MALAFDRPQLERQRGAQRMCGWDHARAGQLGALRQRIAVETDQIGNEQEQPAGAGGELVRTEDEVIDICDGLSVGPDPTGTLLIESTRQGRKAFRGQNLAYGGRAQWHPLLLERLADLVDRVVALAQRDDLVMGAALLGLLVPARSCGGEELRQIAAAKVVTQHAEGARRVAEPTCDLSRGEPLHVESAQSLVLALARGRGLGEETTAIC